MNSVTRPVLSLNKRDEVEAIEEPVIMLDRFEVLLPCRRFQVTYKVAEKGGVSLTGEFLLRLLYAVERMEESAIAEFFGFDSREMAFVMTEMTARDYVVRNDGYVWITPIGRRLFSDNSGKPQIVSVEKRTERFDFDLLSLCPQGQENLNRFAMKLPPLHAADNERVANASREIPQAFERHFAEFESLKRQLGKQRFLYSIDSVSAEQKFLAVVPVRMMAQGGRSGDARADLSEWRNSHELEDRVEVATAVATLLDGLKQGPHMYDSWAYDQLLALAPEFLQDFARRDGLAVDRYHKSAVSRAGDLRADRLTVPLVGSLFTPPNVERLLVAIKYGVKRLEDSADGDEAIAWPEHLFWLAPKGAGGHWGKTRALPNTLYAIRQALQRKGTEPPEELLTTIGVRPYRERSSRGGVMEEFSELRFINEHTVPSPNFELLCIPSVAVAALVHVPIKSQYGFPVPLGLLSFHPEVVARAEAYFNDLSRH